MTESGRLHRTTPKFGKSPVEMLRDKSISDGAARQYAYMHWRYGKNKSNFEGRESVAEALGIRPKTVSNRNYELEQADWLIVIRKYNERTKTTRNVYHLFESQQDCIAWREKFHIEKPAPQAKKTARKTRAGKGGKPTHSKETDGNSSSLPDGNSSSLPDGNSSSHDLDSSDPDTNEPTQKQIKHSDPTDRGDEPQMKKVQPHIAIIDAYWKGLPGGKPIGEDYPRYVRRAKLMVEDAVPPITPDDVTQFMAIVYDSATEVWDYKRWHNAQIPLEDMSKLLQVWREKNTPLPPLFGGVVEEAPWRKIARANREAREKKAAERGR